MSEEKNHTTRHQNHQVHGKRNNHQGEAKKPRVLVFADFSRISFPIILESTDRLRRGCLATETDSHAASSKDDSKRSRRRCWIRHRPSERVATTSLSMSSRLGDLKDATAVAPLTVTWTCFLVAAFNRVWVLAESSSSMRILSRSLVESHGTYQALPSLPDITKLAFELTHSTSDAQSSRASASKQRITRASTCSSSVLSCMTPPPRAACCWWPVEQRASAKGSFQASHRNLHSLCLPHERSIDRNPSSPHQHDPVMALGARKKSLTMELTSPRSRVSYVLAAGRSGETTQQGAKSK